MAAILLSDCTVRTLNVDGVKTVHIVTPASADDGDSIDLSTLFRVGCSSIVSNVSEGSALAVDNFTDRAVTIPGSVDDLIRHIVSTGY